MNPEKNAAVPEEILDHAYMHTHGVPHEHSHGHTHSHTQTQSLCSL